MLPGLRPPETPPRLSRELPGIQDGTGRTGQEERRGKPETGNPAEPICTTGSRSKKGHPEPEKGKSMKKAKCYVVVVNRRYPIPLRHIINTHIPYNEKEFKEWYYADYTQLVGDEFIFCDSREMMLNVVEEVQRNARN